MQDINQIIEDCAVAFTSLIREGVKHGFVSVQLPLDMESPLFPSGQSGHIYWSRPDEHYHAIALGRVFYQTAAGQRRFQIIQKAYQEFCTHWQQAPFAITAFSFDAEETLSNEWEGFPNAFVCVPRVLVEQRCDKKTITFNLDVEADARLQLDEIKELLTQYLTNDSIDETEEIEMPSVEHEATARKKWLLIADKAINAIKKKQFRKLVISRRQCLKKPAYLNTRKLISQLAERYHGCTIISYVEGDNQFIAATPERLLSLNDGYLQSDAIGGTLSEAEARQCSYLVNKQSKLAMKLLDEHAIIIEDICQRLEPVCETLSLPTAPQLKKLYNIYHLETPVSGRVGGNQTVLSLVERLHPTPAIAGFPALESIHWLRDNEGHRRGWYAGAFGWMQGSQSGEISVLLRCALINQSEVNLYAGAGLVTKSDVDQEWQETELKMKTILDLI